MSKEKLYNYTENGRARVVRTLPGTECVGGLGAIKVPVTDVEDIETKQFFNGVPFTVLGWRPQT